MRLICFLSAFLFFINPCFAQFAKIVDKDGFVNVRSGADAKSKIIGQIKSNEIVYIFNGDDFDEWQIVDYATKNDRLLTGYVHHSRIKLLSTYEQIPSVFTTENEAEFTLRNIDVKIKTADFDYEKNKQNFKTVQYEKHAVQQYKNQEVWGTDGTIPKTNYQSITIKIDGKTIEIPAKEMENLFNPNAENSECYYDEKNKKLFIISMNADGAGSYEVLFTIENGKYRGRSVYLAN